VIKNCTCKNAFQGKRYGHGRRVHNQCNAKAMGKDAHRCTVCGKVKEQ
jgi:hypothetical protein